MVCIDICSVDTCKKYSFCSLLDVSYILLVGGTGESFYSLLTLCPVAVLLVTEKGVLKSPVLTMDVSISFRFLLFKELVKLLGRICVSNILHSVACCLLTSNSQSPRDVYMLYPHPPSSLSICFAPKLT